METYEDIIRNRVELLLAIPKWLFNITLWMGTVLFLLMLISFENDFIATIIFFYSAIAIVINAITFLGLIIFSFIYSHYRRSILMSSLILLLNIPVAVVYMIIIDSLHNYGQY